MDEILTRTNVGTIYNVFIIFATNMTLFCPKIKFSKQISSFLAFEFLSSSSFCLIINDLKLF